MKMRGWKKPKCTAETLTKYEKMKPNQTQRMIPMKYHTHLKRFMICRRKKLINLI